MELPELVLTAWPPPYQIRLSKKARRVSLSLSPRKGLEIIIPERLRRRPNVIKLLEEKRDWIEKNAFYLERAQKRAEPPSLPLSLSLLSIQKTVLFSYHETSHKFIKLRSNSHADSYADSHTNSYEILGPIHDLHAVFTTLRLWVKHLAKQHLIPWLDRLSHETELPYSGASIRSQTTLWGSCTAKKKISLNNKLLFLPDYLVRYILLHELCHTRHLNHSKRYWNLLKTFDPHYVEHKRLMREAAQYVPSWLENKEALTIANSSHEVV